MKSYYKILKKIGEGGFSKVHLAKNLKNHSFCAIKEFHITSSDPVENEKLIQQVKFEASLLLKLSHPGLPRIIDYFQIKDKHYIAMDYIEGKDLYSLIKNFPKSLPEIQIIEWGLTICSILEYFHGLKPKPIILRDLKPQNVMLSKKGEIKLIDFGISKPVDTVTRTAAKAFSPGFSPPEQYSSKGGTDIRSDIYSLGATLYYFACKTPPDDALERVLEGKTLEPPGKLRDLPLSKELEEIILKALSIKKENRYQSIKDIKAGLEKIKTKLVSTSTDKCYELTEFFPDIVSNKRKEYKEKEEALYGNENPFACSSEFDFEKNPGDDERDLSSVPVKKINDEVKVVKLKRNFFGELTAGRNINFNISKLSLMVFLPLVILAIIGIYWFFVSPDLALARAKQFTLEKNYRQAEKEYFKVLSIHKNNIEAHEGLLRLYMNTKLFDKALEEVSKLEEIQPEDLKYRYILADKLFENGDYTQAIQNYKFILNKDEGSYFAYLGMGKSYRAIPDYQNSLKWFNKVLELKLTDEQKKAIQKEIGLTYYMEGKDYFEKKFYEEAKKSFEKVSNYINEKKITDEVEKYIDRISTELQPVSVPVEGTPSEPYYHYEPEPYNPPPSSPPSNPDIMW